MAWEGHWGVALTHRHPPGWGGKTAGTRSRDNGVRQTRANSCGGHWRGGRPLGGLPLGGRVVSPGDVGALGTLARRTSASPGRRHARSRPEDQLSSLGGGPPSSADTSSSAPSSVDVLHSSADVRFSALCTSFSASRPDLFIGLSSSAALCTSPGSTLARRGSRRGSNPRIHSIESILNSIDLIHGHRLIKSNRSRIDQKDSQMNQNVPFESMLESDKALLRSIEAGGHSRRDVAVWLLPREMQAWETSASVGGTLARGRQDGAGDVRAGNARGIRALYLPKGTDAGGAGVGRGSLCAGTPWRRGRCPRSCMFAASWILPITVAASQSRRAHAQKLAATATDLAVGVALELGLGLGAAVALAKELGVAMSVALSWS